MSKKFVILDGSSLIFRAFYAMPPLTDSRGEPTGAMVGFDNMLAKLLSEVQPVIVSTKSNAIILLKFLMDNDNSINLK